jgi:hypothetical protein
MVELMQKGLDEDCIVEKCKIYPTTNMAVGKFCTFSVVWLGVFNIVWIWTSRLIKADHFFAPSP